MRPSAMQAASPSSSHASWTMLLLMSAALLVAQAADSTAFPLVPPSTVALLRVADLKRTYETFVQSFTSTLRNSSLPPDISESTLAFFPPTLEALLPSSLPNLKSIDLDQPFYAAALLHASGNLSAPFVPGFLAAPHPALLLLLPGVTLLHLAQLPGLEPANDGSPYHYRITGSPTLCISLAAQGSTGVLAVGLQFYDLTAAPPAAGFELPSGALATMRASSFSLALELSQLDVVLRPLLLAGPSLLTLLDTVLGIGLEFSPLKQELLKWGLSTSVLGAASAIYRELIELTLTLLGDTRAVVLSARLQAPSSLHLGLHACYRNGSYMAKGGGVASPATTASLWPNLPALPSIMAAAGDALSPAAVAEFEAHVFGPALAHLARATQGAALSPAAALLRDAITLMRDLNGPTDGVQLALVNNGAGDPAHPNSPPHFEGDAATRLLAPGVVALFAKGNTVENVWQRHAALLSALRLATGPGLPWARTRSRAAQALLSASGGASLAAPGAPGASCSALDSCQACNSAPSVVCMWCGASGACVDYISSYDAGGRAKVCSTVDTLVQSTYSCPAEPPATLAELMERFERIVDVAETVHNRSIGGIHFENRRIVLTLREGPGGAGAGSGAASGSLEVDTAVGMVGERVLAFALLSDAAVLPFVEAALNPTAAPLFSALPTVNASFAHLPSSRSNVLALRLGAAMAYVTSLRTRLGGKALPSHPQEQQRCDAVLEEEGATVSWAASPTAEGGAVPAGMEVFFDVMVRPSSVQAAPLAPSVPLTLHPYRTTHRTLFMPRPTKAYHKGSG